MSDYYLFLWKATWIQTSGFLALCFFVFARLVWKGWKVYHERVGRWRKTVFIFKGLGWIGIIAVYLLMLYSFEPDWFSKPQWIQGEVQSKVMTQSTLHPYTVNIQSESKTVTLIVDGLTYRELMPGQTVKMSYLTYRLEVVTSVILP